MKTRYDDEPDDTDPIPVLIVLAILALCAMAPMGIAKMLLEGRFWEVIQGVIVALVGVLFMSVALWAICRFAPDDDDEEGGDQP